MPITNEKARSLARSLAKTAILCVDGEEIFAGLSEWGLDTDPETIAAVAQLVQRVQVSIDDAGVGE
ncbi:hypothetical protein [Mycetocola saprophilus]|uniref:hypothetical protein n=1 Tax=Mycetocola saprophilus TaxID=76636 RepID=UPI0004BFEBD2|nr:hypothetical protein [Mycetocola saprophilus]